MIILSASQKKSASTLIFDYQMSLMKLASKRNGQSILQKFSKGRGYRGNLNLKTVLILVFVNLFCGNVVLKTHSGPTFLVKLLVSLNLAKVTYSYRDPRDAVLSILDHAKRKRSKLIEKGQSLDTSRGFADVLHIENAIDLVKEDMKNWHDWRDFGDVYFIRYEDFVLSKVDVLKAISEYFGLLLDHQTLLGIVQEYDGDKNRNFNKGLSGRFKSEFQPAEVSILNESFNDDLMDMGYD